MNIVQKLKMLGLLSSVRLEDLTGAQVELTRDVVGSYCGHPERYDEELIDADPEKIARYLDAYPEDGRCIRNCHKALASVSGTGSFPKGCHRDWANRHVVKYFVNHDTYSSNWTRPVRDSELDKMLELVVWTHYGDWRMTREWLFDRWAGKPMYLVSHWFKDETYRRMGVTHIETKNKSEAQIIVTNRPISGPTIGIGWFNYGTCQAVEYHTDSTWSPNLPDATDLDAHENGHCNRLEHDFAGQGQTHYGIMSYTSPPDGHYYGFCSGESPFPNWLGKDPSYNELQGYYGTERGPLIDGPTEPEPPPVPIDPEVVASILAADPAFIAIVQAGVTIDYIQLSGKINYPALAGQLDLASLVGSLITNQAFMNAVASRVSVDAIAQRLASDDSFVQKVGFDKRFWGLLSDLLHRMQVSNRVLRWPNVARSQELANLLQFVEGK